MYEIKQIPIPKYFDTNTARANIFHVDLGTEQSTINTLKGTKSASYHFYYPRHGKYIIQFVPTEKGAWHSGVVSSPTPRASSFFGSENPNKQSIGHCFEGKPVDAQGKVTWDWSKAVDGERASDKQVDMCVWLMKHIGLDELPNFVHQEITSYKPKIVHDFKERVGKALKGDMICSLEMFSTNDMIKEIVSRFRR